MSDLHKVESNLLKRSFGLKNNVNSAPLMKALKMESTEKMLILQKIKFMKKLNENILTTKILNLLMEGNIGRLKKDKFSFLGQILNTLNVNERIEINILLEKCNDYIIEQDMNGNLEEELNIENERTEKVKSALNKIGALRRKLLIELLTIEKIKTFKNKQKTK